MFSSLAIQNEERQYFDLNGQIASGSEPDAVRVGGKYRLPIMQKELAEEHLKESKRSALDPSPISMIQHYNEEHKAYIQYI